MGKDAAEAARVGEEGVIILKSDVQNFRDLNLAAVNQCWVVIYL